MSSVSVVVGLIGAIIIISLVVAAYNPIMGSVAADAEANNVSNTSGINESYARGTEVATGFIGLNLAFVAVLFILLIIAVWMLMFAL